MRFSLVFGAFFPRSGMLILLAVFHEAFSSCLRVDLVGALVLLYCDALICVPVKPFI